MAKSAKEDLDASVDTDARTLRNDIARIKQKREQEQDSLALQVERITLLGTYIYDESQDRYLYASPGCARIHAVSEEEFVNSVNSVEDDIEDVHESDRERVREAYIRYFNTAEDCKIEYRIVLPDGEHRWIRELLVALEKKDGKASLTRGVLQDITDQKTIEMELRKAKQDLEQLIDERTRELADTVSQLQVEIDERKKVSDELEFLANHDPLTGLPSLRLCKDRLERSLAQARRAKDMVAVMFIDLDGFKEVNDMLGHEAGDQVLKTTASRIKAEIRETDTVARIGGDEFIVILSGLPDHSIAERIATSLIQQVAQTVEVNQQPVHVSASIGIALYPDDGSDSRTLMRVADKAMYQIKHTGKNNFGYHRPEKLN